MRKRILNTVLALISLSTLTYAQTKVEIFPNVQRFLNGEVSELDRSIFFNMHNSSNDAETQKLRSDYNVYSGRGFWGAFSDAKNKTKEVGTYPTFRSGDVSVRSVNGHIATEHPENVARYNSVDPEEAGAWAANYYKYWVSDAGRPEYFEPMNEPFVHANDEVFKAEQPDDQLMRVHMAKIFGEVGKAIHAAPELANMKVIGYSSAWPSVELWDFEHWETRMKMFMDVAGEHMDAFATHLYDGINIAGADNQRSGSNADAILDLIETYSYAKWGKIVPHAISEFGGIEKGYGDDWSEIASIQSLKSINHILMGLLEREDRMEIAIPFITGKAEWHITEANNYQPYGAVLWIPAPDQFGKALPASSQRKWVYSPRIRFFQMWSDVKGKRVQYASSNPDVQVQAFADGNKLHVILSNLSSSKQEVELNFSNNLQNFESLRTKRLKIYDYESPVYTNELLTFALPFIELIPDETVVLEYHFSSELTFNETVQSKKYYTSEHLKPIVKDQAINFNINNVSFQGTEGKASLFLSIGRKHSMSKQAEIRFNGEKLTMPDNWAGYDQSNRDDFFGRLEIPVDYSLLEENNSISITFPDEGGRVSSLILDVEEKLDISDTQAYPDQTPHPIPGRLEAEDYDLGGSDISYHDASPESNAGTAYRSDGVDIYSGASVDDYSVEMDNGEWMKYTVSVEKSAQYKISASLATVADHASFLLKEEELPLSDTLDFSSTGSMNTFQTIETSLFLSAGLHELSIHQIAGQFRINSLDFASEGIDSLHIVNAPTLVSPSLNYNLTLSYKALSSRDIKISLYKDTTLFGTRTIRVPKGNNDTSILLDLNQIPPADSGYFLQSELKSISENWSTPITTDYLNNITVLVDSIDETSLPLSFKAEETTSVPVIYQTAGTRDLVIQLYREDVFITEVIKTTEQGINNESIDLLFNELPKAGDNYVWKVFLVAPGHPLSEASTFKVLENISVKGEKVSLENAPLATSPNLLYKIEVPYEAFGSRKLILELWEKDSLLASRSEIVGTGVRTKLIPLRLDALPQNGDDYVWKVYITPVSGSKEEAINADSIQNVIISDGTSIKNQTVDASFEVYPNPSSTSVFVKRNSEMGTAQLHLFNALGELILKEVFTTDVMQINTMHELSKGIYIIQMQQNGTSSSRKLVIQ